MPDATTLEPEDPDYVKMILVDAYRTYIAANAGPFAPEVLAYADGVTAAQVAALAAHKMKVVAG